MKTIFEEMGGSYSEVGGCRLPNLIMMDTPSIGIRGQRHLRWLKRNCRVTYTNLLTTGELYDYLHEIDSHANEQFELLIRQLAKAEGITEQLKAEDQMEWVRQMNSIRNQAEDSIFNELIYC